MVRIGVLCEYTRNISMNIDILVVVLVNMRQKVYGSMQLPIGMCFPMTLCHAYPCVSMTMDSIIVLYPV